MSEVICLATYDFAPEAREKWLAFYGDIAAAIRAEPVYIGVMAEAGPVDVDRVHQFQHYRDSDAWDEHLKNPAIAAYIAGTKGRDFEPLSSTRRMLSASDWS